MNFVRPGSAFGVATEPPALQRPRRKWPISYNSIGLLAISCDVATILLCGVASGVLYNLAVVGIPGDAVQYFAAATVVAVLFTSLLKMRDQYNPADLLELRSQIRDVTAAWVSVFLFLFGALFTLKIGTNFSRVATFSFGVAELAILILQRLFYRFILIRGLRGEKFAGRNAVLITDSAQTTGSALTANLLRHGFHLTQQFVLPINQQHQVQQEEFIADVIQCVRGSDIEEIIVNVDLTRWGELKKLIAALRLLPLPINLIPAGVGSEILSKPSHFVGSSVCVELQRGPLTSFERGVKRSIDLVGALAGIILLLPLLTLTVILIKLDTRGPVFFYQKRCGFNGRIFHIFKFRTMTVLEDGSEIRQAEQSDDRVTRVGWWLRRTSIDELPQLLNVLNGTMSLVGPRPHAVAHDSQFDKVVSNYAFRHQLKPGLTGWAQVNGHRGPTPTLSEIQSRVEYDLWYIDNWSLRLDLMIMLRTVVEVTKGRNAY